MFLGDFVDRGYYSLETFTRLMTLKAKYPDRVVLLRGNHETRQITQVYGFYDECVEEGDAPRALRPDRRARRRCQNKYGNANAWRYCCQVFDLLSVSALIDGTIFCVHGGLSPEVGTLDQIRTIERNVEIPHEGAFCDLVWSDPDEVESWALSPRGAGYIFGAKVTKEFTDANGIELICRAHQLVQEGYKFMFPSENLVTVWSAPNYCYRCGNVASILSFDEGLGREAKLFHAVPNEERVIPEQGRRTTPYFL